jgi:hypothetical protein
MRDIKQNLIPNSASWTPEERDIHEHRSLQRACKDAIDYATKHGVDTAVFRNLNGICLHRELRFCDVEAGITQVLFIAVKSLCEPRQKRLSREKDRRDASRTVHTSGDDLQERLRALREENLIRGVPQLSGLEMKNEKPRKKSRKT